MTVRWQWFAFAVIAAASAAGCASSDEVDARTDRGAGTTATVQASEAGVGSDLAPADPLEGITIKAELGYPRDLLERGRVNLVVTRDDPAPLVITRKRLVADHFSPPQPEERRSTIPSGRPVAVQTEFGTVADCDSTAPASAALEVTYTYGDSPILHEGAIPLADSSLLDELRARFCSVEAIQSSNQIEVVEPVTGEAEVTATVEMTRKVGDDELVIEAITGTVLFGASSPIAEGDPGRTLASDASSLAVPIVVDVNRCDSHAVAETTKKFGVDFWISTNGGAAQPVPIPIGPMLGQLEALLEECQRGDS